MAWLEVVRANVRKVVLEMVRYLPNTLSLVVTFYAIFLTLLLGIRVVGDPAGAGDEVRYLIVANAFWFLLLVSINSLGFEISTEATRGTLEQLYMSPFPATFILLARMAGTLAAYLVIIVGMVLLSMATARTWLNVDLPLIAAILAPTLAGVVGLGFAVGGLALLFKQIQSLLQVGPVRLSGPGLRAALRRALPGTCAGREGDRHDPRGDGPGVRLRRYGGPRLGLPARLGGGVCGVGHAGLPRRGAARDEPGPVGAVLTVR